MEQHWLQVGKAFESGLLDFNKQECVFSGFYAFCRHWEVPWNHSCYLLCFTSTTKL